MILWNFPNDSEHFRTITSVLHFIESCWTCFTGEYNTDGSPVMESLGFAYCLPCKQGAISYVMKYMKKQFIPPAGKNPLFFLTSRKMVDLALNMLVDSWHIIVLILMIQK